MEPKEVATYRATLLGEVGDARLLDTLVARMEGGDLDFSLVLLNLNEFRLVNQVYGHDVGDSVLVSITHGLQQALPPSAELVAATSGYFFVVTPEQSVQASEMAKHWVAVVDGCAVLPDGGASLKEFARSIDFGLTAQRGLFTRAAVGAPKEGERWKDFRLRLSDLDAEQKLASWKALATTQSS